MAVPVVSHIATVRYRVNMLYFGHTVSCLRGFWRHVSPWTFILDTSIYILLLLKSYMDDDLYHQLIEAVRDNQG